MLGFSQTTPVDSTQTVARDTIGPLKYYFNNLQSGGLFLDKPSETIVRYDKELNKFVIIEKIGDYYTSTPMFLTPEEYEKYRLKNDMKDYFKEKVGATNSKKKSKNQKNLLPKYYVNSKFFESVFGGTEVEVIPSGQISIKLGGVYQKNENPSVSIENQSSFTFDFDQQISASLIAKVGKRLNVTANYDTQATFGFQDQIKLEYTPTEDDIIQNIEAGNISMPIKNSLINGAQALFGVKTELQFGKTHVTAAFSQQNSESRTVVAQGGATVEPYELRATDYDNDRHFFLAQYFRDNFKNALKQYPLISSPISITRVEVWVTNRNTNTQDFRNIVGFADLGESTTQNLVNQEMVNNLPATPTTAQGVNLPYNDVNNLKDLLQVNTGGIRDVSTLEPALNNFNNQYPTHNIEQGLDYSYLQNARRLQPNEFTLNSQLGYISLNRRLNDGEILAVAFEYTVVGASNGESIFRVGEFSNDAVAAPANIAVKLLRSEIIRTTRDAPNQDEAFPTWRLMMKNIYTLPVFPIQQDGFRFELLYRDDVTGTLQNTLQNASDPAIKDKVLLNFFDIDRLDQSQFEVPDGDGFFDFVEGATINSQRGQIIFPEPEPFGKDLEGVGQITNPSDIDKYVFKELYLTTKAQAKNEYQHKDKFFLKGYLKSDTQRGIRLNAFNIPRGSVRVSAGGRPLVEGVDYVVDYDIGIVQILDPGLEASGVPITARVENQSFFNQQRKTFLGVDIEHRFSEDFTIGGTFLNVNETPITPKINFGAEPINNIMLGFNLDYSSEVPYLTKLTNKLPFVDTDAVSNVSVRADIAYLLPGSPSGIDVNGQATSYVDDFEASQIPIDISSPLQWFTASTPKNEANDVFNGGSLGLDYNDKRARLSWYTIDQLFYSSSGNVPSNINANEISREETRQVRFTELFENQDLDITQLNFVRTLDLAYFPSERGPYNFDVGAEVNTNGTFTNPEDRWGGIMRALTTNNFEQANVEYVQFWLMDPYDNYSITQAEGLPAGVDPNNPINQTGEFVLNLGNISEDILKDNLKQYENGLSADGSTANTQTTPWGRVSTNQSILYAFDATDESRTNQDVGLDGLKNEDELAFYQPNITGDISKLDANDFASDNFQYFRGSDYDAIDASVLTRYKKFNNTEGNSPTANQSTEPFPTSSTTYPDVEDINKDQTMNTIERYFEYKVSLDKADLVQGINNIVDTKTTTVELPNGESRATTWYQFRIPVRSGTAINNISDFNSIRFMRMYLTKFRMPVVMRMAELQLVRGDWRRYTKTLDPAVNPQGDLTDQDLKDFEVGVVNIEENEERYVLPPGIQREELQGTNRIQRQNEQSVTLKVEGLKEDKIRAIYKNISIDLRRYKNLKMFMHAEATKAVSLTQDDEMVAIIRLGTDLNDNFYQIEMPLKISDAPSQDPFEVWKEENNLDLELEKLGQLKLDRDAATLPVNMLYPAPDPTDPTELIIRVKGNPTLAQVRTVMLGVKNTSPDPSGRSAEIWFNELRAVGFDNKGGWAAVLSADANFADVANVSLTGRMSTVGFGNVEDRVQERSIEEVKQYDVSTSVELAKVVTPKKWNMQIPMSYSYGEEFRDPKYNPQYQDVLQQDALASTGQAQVNAQNAQDYTRRKSISFINVKKNRNPESTKKPKFYDAENFSVSYAYNEEFHKDYNIENYTNKNVVAGANYNFSFLPWSYEPFKKSKGLKGKWWELIRDINFNPVPKSIAINSRINRTFNEQQSRNLLPGFSAQPTLTQRRFLFNWDYTIGFDLTKSLALNFNATNSYIYDKQNEQIDVFDKFFAVGRPDHYHQTLQATYKIPINKIPVLNFIKADYAYDADFDWRATSQSYVDEIGNMIQNGNKHNVSANIDFERFYKNIKLDKLFIKGNKNQKKVRSNPRLGNLPQAPAPTRKLKKNASTGQKILKGVYDVITSVKRAKITYSETNQTLLQGYVPTIGFLGRDNTNSGLAPTLGFVFGSQTEILNTAIRNNWLVTREEGGEYFNKNYGRNNLSNLDYTVSVKPFKDVIIDVRGNRVKTNSINQQLDVISDALGNTRLNEDLKSFETGNFSTSHFMMGTAFTNSDDLYTTFLDYRSTISERLARENNLPISGYNNTSQDVLLPAFMAAYSGNDPNSVNTGLFRNIPIPNWTLRYNGLMKYKWFKKNFSAFSVSHGYKSSYSIVGYTNNLAFGTLDNPGVNTSTGNFNSERLISTATLIDEFSPLVKVDFKMRNSLSFRGEVRKDRALTLNFNNNTLTDIKGTEYVVGFGYKIRDVKFNTRFAGKKETLKGDINLRADVSMRDNLTLIRSIDLENNQITGGEKLFSLRFLADYNLSSNLTASFYYNHQTFNYAVSTTFPRQSINAGINIIYKLTR